MQWVEFTFQHTVKSAKRPTPLPSSTQTFKETLTNKVSRQVSWWFKRQEHGQGWQGWLAPSGVRWRWGQRWTAAPTSHSGHQTMAGRLGQRRAPRNAGDGPPPGAGEESPTELKCQCLSSSSHAFSRKPIHLFSNMVWFLWSNSWNRSKTFIRYSKLKLLILL